MADAEKPKAQAPSFARQTASHKQEKRERRAAYRQFVNRFHRKKEVKGERQTAARLGFSVVMALGHALLNGRWSYKRRFVRRPA